MHAQVTKVKLQPGTMGRACDQWRSNVLPAMQTHAGYLGVLFLTDRSKDEGYAIVLFDDASVPAEVHSDPNVGSTLGLLARFFAGRPSQEAFEVAIDDRR